MTENKLGAYENRALSAIASFKNPESSRFAKVVEAVQAPVESVTEAAFDTKAGEAVTKAIAGVMEKINDGASWSVRPDAIFDDFRNEGFAGITSFDSVHTLDLASVDKVVGNLGAKYTALGAASGGVAGFGGIAGLAADIPALIGLALRACNEYAAYYGFDPAVPVEQAFIMHLMAAASSTGRIARRNAVRELTELSVRIGARDSWDELDDALSSAMIRRIAEMLGVRIAKGKLAQTVPLLGTFVGAGYNAWYLGQVTQAANLMYQERFLIERFGVHVVIPVLD